MSSRDPSSLAWDDGETRQNMQGRNRSGSSFRASQRRAAKFRPPVEQNLRQQGEQGAYDGELLRQRFDNFRNSSGIHNNTNRTNELNNLSDRSLQDEVNQWTLNAHDRTRLQEIELSEQLARTRRLALSQVPRVGNLSPLKGDNMFRWMYCQVNGMATNQIKLRDIMKLAEKFEADG